MTNLFNNNEDDKNNNDNNNINIAWEIAMSRFQPDQDASHVVGFWSIS